MFVLDVMKTFNRNDLKLLLKPMALLFGFLLLAGLFFPKPSQIYREGILRKCTCLGLKATPRHTKGSFVGDEYCMGMPISCTEQQILKNLPTDE